MKIRVNLGDRSYDCIVEAGGLAHIGEYANLDRSALIITDDGVPPVYAQTVASQCTSPIIATIPQGEGSKSLAQFEKLCALLLENHFTRSDVVIAVGGGVVGDLAGFVAASYMRGIDFINVPTTSLAQIDSSIGGKVAINFGDTKNIIGAFHQPILVLADTDTLKTLTPRIFTAGLAEAIKAGVIDDEELFTLFETTDAMENFPEILRRSLDFKRRIVEEDEKEGGIRAILNFGHTIGHAIETSVKEENLYHGECVALGMLPMMENEADKQRLIALYKKLGLPYEIDYNKEEIYSILTHDKKATSKSQITIIKSAKIGSCRMDKVAMEEIKSLV